MNTVRHGHIESQLSKHTFRGTGIITTLQGQKFLPVQRLLSTWVGFVQVEIIIRKVRREVGYNTNCVSSVAMASKINFR